MADPDPNAPANSDAALNQNATSPRKVMVDGNLAEAHPLPDQISADRYINSKAATRKRGKGWRSLLSQLVPPGTIGGGRQTGPTEGTDSDPWPGS